jgi:hypothetical protein
MSRALANFWHRLISGSLQNTQPKASWSLLPNGFEIIKLFNTGIFVVDNFCTPEEAGKIIEAAKNRMVRSGVLVDGRFRDSDGRISETARLFGLKYRYSGVVPLMRRAAALVGLPYTHLEDVYVTRYTEGGFYATHIDFGDAFGVDRLYTLLLYLNSMPEEQGGSTVFPTLKTAVQPKIGRAVAWTNKNPDGSGHLESNHAAFPVKNGGEKWVIQFWFRRYRMIEPIGTGDDTPAKEIRPLRGDEILPEGVHGN